MEDNANLPLADAFAIAIVMTKHAKSTLRAS